MSNILKIAGAGGVAEETDENFNQTVLLLHGDGTNGAQNNTFLDSSTNNFTITRNGNTTQGTFSPFSAPDGRWSNYFDGTGDFLSFTDTSNDLDLGGAQASLEMWVYFLNTTTTKILFVKGGGANSYSTSNGNEYLILVESGLVKFFYNNGGVSANITGAVVNNAWSHIVVATDASNNIALFVNGTRASTASNAISKPTTRTGIRVAESFAGSEAINAYFSNIRHISGANAYDPTDTTITVPTAPLTAVSGTSLLTCQSNRFVDNSTNNFAITRNGDVKVTPFSPFAPTAAYSPSVNGGSGYFDGTGDYLVTTGAAALAIGTSAFTLEGWCYFNNVNTSGAGFGTCAAAADATGDRGVSLFLTGAGAWRFRVGRAATGQFEDFLGTTTLVAGQWYHFKMVRTSTGSNDTRIYLNGVQEAIGTSTISLNMEKFAVGTYVPSDATVALLNGYVAGVRFTNTAESSAVPTAPPTAVSGTQYLANFTNAGIFDQTGKNNLETAGNAQIDTTVKKYGTGSMEFDGSGDALIVYDPSFQNSPGGGDWTFECWVYFNALPANYTALYHLKNDASTSTTVFIVEVTSTGKLNLSTGTALIVDGTSSLLTTGSWIHIAVTRASGTIRTFVNGTQDKSVANTTTYNGTYDLFGVWRYSGSDFYLNGYIDDLRITKGVARYTSNFTAPTKAFPDL